MLPLHNTRLVCLLLLTAACAHWEAQTRPIPEVVAAQPEQLLVTRHDGSTLILVDPVVVDSSLVGSLRTPRGKARRDITIQISFSQIASVATWDPGSPTVFKGVGFGVLGAVAGAMIICFATGGCDQ